MRSVPRVLFVAMAAIPLSAALLAGLVVLFHYVQPWLIAAWILGGMVLVFSLMYAIVIISAVRFWVKRK